MLRRVIGLVNVGGVAFARQLIMRAAGEDHKVIFPDVPTCPAIPPPMDHDRAAENAPRSHECVIPEADVVNASHGKTTILMFVRWPDVPAYQRLGWVYLYPAPGHHGDWSAIMEWPHGAEPLRPDGLVSD